MKNEIDTYIASFEKADRAALEALRDVINSAGKFKECLSYGMPGFRHGDKVAAGFRMCSRHIGFYPHSGAILAQFKSELKEFKTSSGALQLPHGKQLPKALIKRIIKARVKEIEAKQKKG